MKSFIAGLAFMAVSASTSFAAPTQYPSADPGVGLWYRASGVAVPADADAQLAQKDAVNGLHFRVLITERGDDTTNENPATEIMKNRLWDSWEVAGHFDSPRTVALLYMPDHSGGPGWLSVRVGHRLNMIGIAPDHLNSESGPIRPVRSEYFPDRTWEGMMKIIDNLNYEYKLGHVVNFTASGPIAKEVSSESLGLGTVIFWFFVVLLTLLGLATAFGSGRRGPRPSSRVRSSGSSSGGTTVVSTCSNPSCNGGSSCGGSSCGSSCGSA